MFVVQRHDARRLHYDFRLERDGALASWAVPKGIPTEPGGRALAVHVEDHPIEYAKFEGEIPKGQYGAGTVELWDTGTYELLEEKRDGGLTFRLHGKRYEGVWTLVPARMDGKEQNWLLLKKGEGGVRRTHRYAPMLATLSDDVPHGDDWLYEVKWDGYRALAYVEQGVATLLSRRDNDLTTRFAPIATALGRLPDCVVDGEVCALDEQGRSSFSAMQQGSGPLVYYTFDLLEDEGQPLLDRPLTERRDRLERVLRRAPASIRLSDAFDDGDALYTAAEEQGLEGIIAKRASAPYREGKRTREWLKVKTHGNQEFVVAGYTKGSGTRATGFGSLVLGVQRDGNLEWAGNVGTGFTQKEIERLLKLLRPLQRETT